MEAEGAKGPCPECKKVNCQCPVRQSKQFTRLGVCINGFICQRMHDYSRVETEHLAKMLM
jgi:hypothetical protein